MLIQKICNLFELFPAFICGNNIGSLVNNLLGVKIFNPVHVVFLFRGHDKKIQSNALYR